jgi:hypothetical protein
MAIDRRLPEEAELEWQGVQEGCRYRAGAIEQRCAVLGAAGKIRCLLLRRPKNVRHQRLEHACDGRVMGKARDRAGQAISEMTDRVRY